MNVKSYILFLTLISCFIYSQNESVNDSVFWSEDAKLKWSDFKGAVPFGDLGIKKAASSLEIVAEGVEFYLDSIPVFKIEAIFIKTESWTILKTEDLLKHEQGHFDITEIYARKLRKIYCELNKKKVADFNIYGQAFEKINSELHETHKFYDKEVYFIPENQIKWSEKISNELTELEEYKLKK